MASQIPLPKLHITKSSGSQPKTSSFVDNDQPKSQAMGHGQFLTCLYSTRPSFSTSDDSDLAHHVSVNTAADPHKFFPVAGGTAFAYVDFAPNPDASEGPMHRTQTVDYVVVLQGELELGVEGGETRVLRPGDAAVQRAVMHKWKNLSGTQSARFLCVSVGVKGAVEGGIEFG